MLHSSAAAQARTRSSLTEVGMPKALKVVVDESRDVGQILVKRDGQPDLLIKSGRLVLTVETQAVGQPGNQRWKVFKLYEPSEADDILPWLARPAKKKERAVVAEEGHSEKKGETTRYSAYVCTSGVAIWEAMDRIDELKPKLADLGWPVVEEL